MVKISEKITAKGSRQTALKLVTGILQKHGDQSLDLLESLRQTPMGKTTLQNICKTVKKLWDEAIK